MRPITRRRAGLHPVGGQGTAESMTATLWPVVAISLTRSMTSGTALANGWPTPAGI